MMRSRKRVMSIEEELGDGPRQIAGCGATARGAVDYPNWTSA